MKKKRRPKTAISPRTWLSNPLVDCPASFRVLALFVLLLSWLAGSAIFAINDPKTSQAEKPYALIFGTVWGPDDHPVYGVKVKIRREADNKARWDLHSDHRGEFAQRVPAGKQDYVVWADLKGLKLANGMRLKPGEEVKVHIENDERVDIGIHLKEF